MLQKVFCTLSAALASLLAMPSAAAAFGLPDATTDRGRIVEDIYIQVTIAALVVFLVVIVWLLVVLIRYREGSGHGQATYETERDNLKLEFGWVIVPLIVVLWVGWISYGALLELDEEANEVEPYTEINIIGFQWFWQAEYETGLQINAQPGAQGDLTDTQRFVIPANEPVRFNITGGDVIHSFNIVELAQTLDATPGVNTVFTASLPEGEYFTQCKEHCLNPGHAYMRAIVEAVPAAEYETWLENATAGAAAGLQQHVPVLLEGGDMGPTNGVTKAAKGAALSLQFANNETEGVTVSASGAANGSVEVGPGQTAPLELNLTEEGTLTFNTDAGHSFTLDVVEPETISVDLADFEIHPDPIQLEVGEVYVIEAENFDSAVHNIYIGPDGADGKTEAIWNSPDINPGETKAFLVIPSEPMTVDSWCAVSGHYTAGMHGDVAIDG